MSENLYGFVNYTNAIDLSALDKEDKISNSELKEIIMQLHSILEQTTLALTQTKLPVNNLNDLILNLPNEKVLVGTLTGLSYRKIVARGANIGVTYTADEIQIEYLP